MDNITALVSCFARADHYKNCERHVFADPVAEHMDADEATDAFLKESGMTAPAGVGYCLVVRKG